MNCIHLRQRSKKYKPYFFCKFNKQQTTLSDCRECSELKCKETKPIKKKSKKQAKLERNRFSIITDDLEHCYICTERGIKNVNKDDLHEVYGGRNRRRSIENGLVIPLCRKCHEDKFILEWLKRFVQLEYEEIHTREDFIKLIGKSYIK